MTATIIGFLIFDTADNFSEKFEWIICVIVLFYISLISIPAKIYIIKTFIWKIKYNLQANAHVPFVRKIQAILSSSSSDSNNVAN